MSISKNIIISGGGTGGHIYPAVAIANELMARYPHFKILFVGAEGKMEMEKVPKAGYEIVGLPIAGINRSNMLANLSFPFKLVKSLRKARGIVKNFGADIAIGVGGYASGPTLLMANAMGIPTLIQEQNSYAGITNKWLSKKAKKICVAYPDMQSFFPAEKLVFTGNPVRKDLIDNETSKNRAREVLGLDQAKKTLLIIGGSQGALSINKAITAALPQFASSQFQVIWQTGKNYFTTATEAVTLANISNVIVKDFIYNMDQAYAAADIVISRAGALSVSELCLAAKPSILVPFPNAAEDHQTKNAMSLAKNDAAILVKDSETEKLFKTAADLLENTEILRNLSQNIKKLAKPKASELIVNEIEKVLNL